MSDVIYNVFLVPIFQHETDFISVEDPQRNTETSLHRRYYRLRELDLYNQLRATHPLFQLVQAIIQCFKSTGNHLNLRTWHNSLGVKFLL